MLKYGKSWWNKVIHSIKKVQKMVKNGPKAKSLVSGEAKPRLGRREREQEEQYERLMERVAKIKDEKRQQQLEDQIAHEFSHNHLISEQIPNELVWVFLCTNLYGLQYQALGLPPRPHPAKSNKKALLQ